MQRQEAAQRQSEGTEWKPRLFRKVRGGPGGAEEGEEDLSWILKADMFVTHRIDSRINANITSNGSTPEEITKQILAVAPIIQGQKLGQQEPVTQQKEETTQPPKSTEQPPQTQQKPAQPPPQSVLPTRPASQPAHPDLVPTNKGSLIEIGEDPTAHSVQSQQAVHNDAMPPGLQQPLQPIRRQDSNTNEVDEFVDADDGQ
jgi:hypothetical protein